MSGSVLLTCEHAGNHVPSAYAHLFRGASRILSSHRGWDPGSLELGRAFERKLGACLLLTQTTRLLVEVNRSVGHPRLFSEYTAQLNAADRQEILARYYYPHRRKVESWIADRVTTGSRVVHVSLHTFAPELDGEVRDADIGLLYDPQRSAEKAHCEMWQASIRHTRPELRVRRNYPYRGSADGLTTHLRRRFKDAAYLGIELEVNQKWSRRPSCWKSLAEDLVRSFSAVS